MRVVINLDGSGVIAEVSVYSELYSTIITFYFQDRRVGRLHIDLGYDDIYTAEDLCGLLGSEILTSELRWS